MIKLPEHERPPYEEIQGRLFSRVSKQYRDLFVPDIQNDCACPIESYDCDNDSDTWYLSESNKVEKVLFKVRLDLPMISEISDESILMLLKKACENVGENPIDDVVPVKVLTNPKSDRDKLIKVLSQLYGDASSVVYLDFIPVDDFIMVPEPEFFGALSVNIGGFGAFCFSRNLFKYKV